MKNFKVYQLPTEHNAKFMRLSFVKEHNIMPKLEDYKLVYEGELDDDEQVSEIYDLDTIYGRFQGVKPEGYKGTSISVSDVVFIYGKYFYCDSLGWKEVSFQPKNVITFAPEDVPEEEIGTKEHEITLFYHNIHFAKNGNLLSGDMKIGTWEKEIIGGRDASGNKLVPYLYWITLNGIPSYSHVPFYTRKEVKKSLDCKTVKVLLPF